MRHRQSSTALVLTLIPLLFVAAGIQAQSVRELRPGALIDTDRGHCFVMGPQGIDAIQVRSGARLWHSDDAIMPIAMKDGHLITQAAVQEFGHLALVVLDTETGTAVRTQSIPLPSNVFAHTTDAVGSSFDIWAVPAQEPGEAIQIGWRYEHRLVQGIAPSGEDTSEPPSETSLSGAFRFVPRTGVHTPIAGPARRSQDRLLAEEHQRIEGANGRQFLETRGNHILASDKVADARTWNQYQWTIYSNQGQRLGALETFTSFASFVVHDSLVLFATPPHTRMEGVEAVSSGPTLRAVALANGIEQWSWPLKDTRYQGSFPP